MHYSYNKFLRYVMMIALVIGTVSSASAVSRSYLDEHGNTQSADAEVLYSDSTTLTNGWYVLYNNKHIDFRITITGTVNLILEDGCTLTATKGITLTSGNTLNIYGQTKGTGTITINDVDDDNAGIGGNNDEGNGGTVTINGGTINVTGGSFGAGIGGGSSGDGGTVTINGGTVNANGGQYGAGIGGVNGGEGGTVTINGGQVNANGGDNGAGIGGGYASGGTVTINGGTVNAHGGDDAAGIGGGHQGSGGTVNINGGTVNATGGDGGAGIGGGNDDGGGTFNINGGTVTAIGGSGGMGFGCGNGGSDNGTLTLGANVILQTSDNNTSWTETTDTDTRTQYMKTSVSIPETYTITIPSSLIVSSTGWNALDGGISFDSTLSSDKKLVLTVSSDSGFKFVKSGDTSETVAYYFLESEDSTTTYDALKAQTSWDFTSLEQKNIGIVIADYSAKPAGTYTETVIFTASIEEEEETTVTLTSSTTQ